jgi:hypothetical protein
MGYCRCDVLIGEEVSIYAGCAHDYKLDSSRSFTLMGVVPPASPTPKHRVNVYNIAEVDFWKIITPKVTHVIVDTSENSRSCGLEEIALCHKVQSSCDKLEKSAALILSVLDTASDRGKRSVKWSRAEVNILRKFLFILSSRNSPQWRRFARDNGEMNVDGDPNIRDQQVESFRKKHGLRNARCAWLFSVQNLLETPHWRIPANDRILEDDRREYDEDMRYRQLAIYETPPHQEGSGNTGCGPSECEFPLTDSSLGIEEGVNTLLATDGEQEQSCFEQKMNLPRPCLSSSHESTGRAHAVPLTKIYAISPNLAILLIRVELTLSGDFDFDSGLSNASIFADFPKTTTQVTYRPPLSEIALSFCNKDPSFWTPEDIQREFDFRHHQILDGKIVYSRLGDTMEIVIHKLSPSSVWALNQVLWQGCKEWIATKNADGMMEAMWVVGKKEGSLPDTIKVCNAAPETQLEDGEIDEGDEPEEGVAHYLPGLRGVFTWGREKTVHDDEGEDEEEIYL